MLKCYHQPQSVSLFKMARHHIICYSLLQLFNDTSKHFNSETLSQCETGILSENPMKQSTFNLVSGRNFPLSSNNSK